MDGSPRNEAGLLDPYMFFLVLHPAAPDPRRYETRARRGDSRVPGVRISRREGC